jgi:hypothetical protein
MKNRGNRKANSRLEISSRANAKVFLQNNAKGKKKKKQHFF